MNEKRNLSIEDAANLMGKSKQFVRYGLIYGRLPFGTAVKMSKNWTFYISPEKFYDYIGLALPISNNSEFQKVESHV